MNRSLGMFIFVLAVIPDLSSIVNGQNPSEIIQAAPMAVDARIRAITLYRGRASITRTASIALNPGMHELQFINLPESIQPATLQARATGPVKVLGVEFSQEAATSATSQKIAELDVKIEDLQRGLKEIAQQHELIKVQEDFISAISVRATIDAGKEAGTSKLDLDVLRRQLAFIAEERTKLLNSRRELDVKQRDLEKQLVVLQSNRQSLAGGSNVSRVAAVSVVATEAAQTTVELIYLVANATWEPMYNIRAGVDSSSALVEYDALLTQRTGEDWDEVELTLSTAQPTVAANPPTLRPWFVDVFRPEDRHVARAVESAPPTPSLALPAQPEGRALTEAELKALAADGEVGGGGPSVTFQLPRAVTVKTNIQKQQRTRIASIDAHPKFIHVAVPMLAEAVYLRGELTNGSAYQLLPGPASIFVDQDYVGPTTMASVAPREEFKVHFGIDQAVKARRHLISKSTESTGLLSGGRRTSYDYRLAIDNGTGKPIAVELWDRYPISRDEAIQIELVDMNAPLSSDAYYTTEERPQGLLKWIINVPAGAGGNSTHVVSYGVRINRAKDIEMTPLPE